MAKTEDEGELGSLSKLFLVLHPTNSLTSQSPLLLYSSVVENQFWHLTLIGPAAVEYQCSTREIWWEGQWSLADLKSLLPHHLSHAVAFIIREAFLKNDIALKGYRHGNEAEVRLTICYSEIESAFTVTLKRLNILGIKSATSFEQKPLLNLLEITCQVCGQFNRLAKENDPKRASTSQVYSVDRPSTQLEAFRRHVPDALEESSQGTPNPSQPMFSSFAGHSSWAEPQKAEAHLVQVNTTQKACEALSRFHPSQNLANPSKKARTQAVDGFLSSDDSS
ncbi:hypothetical protein O181_012427 [Austropuccinia psidii MF-1]|uniref:Uncharacterized protein n=1 Tax=Austropuccinia psidii MF-1 TaxID=1389203 RepID=A0A9Q3BXP4_9BASI|nr:hypothetical protein [Austropuccinia psidii MF-1]